MIEQTEQMFFTYYKIGESVHSDHYDTLTDAYAAYQALVERLDVRYVELRSRLTTATLALFDREAVIRVGNARISDGIIN